MLNILKTIAGNARAEFTMTAIERRWRKAGVPAPRFMAAQEVALRAVLESFRDYATARYLDDGVADLDAIKQQWFATRLKPMTVAIGAEKANMLQAAVEVMPANEVLHADAYRAWCREADGIVDEMRRRGASGLMRRVLVAGR